VLARLAPVSLALWACVAVVAFWRPAPLPDTGGRDEDAVQYYREGRAATVKVFQSGDDARQRIMAIDGVVIGQSGAGVDKKQQVLAHFPFLLQERAPRTVLTIGLGTGILAGELARHPGVERVEVVEIAHGVVEGAREFERWNGGALHDPRVAVVEDDGINYLKRARGRYDVIVSDGKSRSGHAGNAAFFAEEYYQAARAHLAPDGAMLQWVPLEVPADDLRTIVRTFERVFPHVYVWIAQESSFLVGRLEPLALDLDRVQRVLDAPETADLRRYGWDRAEEVAAFLVADETTLAPWLGAGGPVNSLEWPVLEFYAPGPLAEPEPQRVASNMAALVELRRRAAPAPLQGAAPQVAAAFETAAEVVDGAAELARGDLRGVARVGRAVARATPDGLARHWAAEAIFGAARALDLRGRVPDAVALYREALAAWPGLAEANTNLGRDLALEGRPDEAVEYLRRALRLNPESGSAHRQLADLLVARGEIPEALEEARAAVRLAPRSAPAHAGLGLATALAGNPGAAIPELLEASRLQPSWPLPLARAALLLATRAGAPASDVARGVELAERAAGLAGPGDVMSLEVLAATYAASGRFPDAVATQQRAVDAATAAGDRPLAAAAAAVVDRYRRGQALDATAR
jgi:spermidine synthase